MSYLNFWNNKIYNKPLWIYVKLVTVTLLSPLLSKKLHWNTLRHTWDTVILLTTAYFKHFEHFPNTEIFEIIKFTANHCYCPKLFTVTWLSPLLSKTLQGNTLRHTLDTVILLKSAYFKHFEHFPAIEIFEIIKFTANHYEYVCNLCQ